MHFFLNTKTCTFPDFLRQSYCTFILKSENSAIHYRHANNVNVSTLYKEKVECNQSALYWNVMFLVSHDAIMKQTPLVDDSLYGV